jgi:hypothetical protein
VLSVDEIASMIGPAAENAGTPLIATSTGTCPDPRESAAADIRLFRKVARPGTVLRASGASTTSMRFSRITTRATGGPASDAVIRDDLRARIGAGLLTE